MTAPHATFFAFVSLAIVGCSGSASTKKLTPAATPQATKGAVTDPDATPTAEGTATAEPTPEATATVDGATPTPTATPSSGSETPTPTPSASASPSPTASPTPGSPSLSTSQSAMGSVTYGSTGTKTITVTNNGTAAATSLAVSVTAGAWAKTGGTCTTSLAVNASCTLVFTFSPTGVATSTATVTISYTGGSVNASLSGNGNAATVTVAAVYPNNPKWNDYVKNAVVADGAYAQADTACDGTETAMNSCIHGGEKRKVVLSTDTSCIGITATDVLGAFNWTCQVISGNATVLMQGLKDGKGLSDLVNAASWKSNSVQIYKNSVLIAESTSTTWWTNTVGALPTNPLSSDSIQTLSTPSKIYTLSASTTSSGYSVEANGVAIVMLSSAKLSYSGNSSNNIDATTGETGSMRKGVISAGSQDFLWLEGTIDCYNASATADYGILLHTTRHTRIHRLEAARCVEYGVNLPTSNNNLLTYVNVAKCGVGLAVDGNFNRLINIHGSNFSASVGNASGVTLNGTDNVLVRSSIASSDADGFTVTSARATLHAITAMNNGATGVNLSGTNITATQIAAANNSSGINIDGTGFKGAQLASTHNASTGFVFSTATNSVITHALAVGNSGWRACDVSGGTNVGVTNISCAVPAGKSYTYLSTANITNHFVGKVTSTDGDSDSNGTKAHNSISDWFSFDNIFRGWGKSHSDTFPSSNHQSACTAGQTCQVWDWRVKLADTTFRNKSGDFQNDNGTFSSSAACPNAVASTMQITNGNASASTYLVNAVEIVGDSIGNENGLCESNESCIYQPNIGAYLGEDDYLTGGYCQFTDGTISGVKVYAYPTNGG